MSIHIDVNVDDNGIPAKLRKLAALMQEGFYSAFVKIAIRLRNEQVAITPVDSGQLAASIQELAHQWGVNGIATAHDHGYDYAKINHDGGIGKGWYGPHRIPARHYMTIPLQASIPYIITELDVEVAKKIALSGL